MRGRPNKSPEELTGIGANVRRMRMKKGWTIKEAAKCAGVSVDTWARWEQTNSLDVAAGRLSAAATVFNLDVEDILL